MRDPRQGLRRQGVGAFTNVQLIAENLHLSHRGYGMHGSWFLFLHSSDSMAAVSSGVFEWNCLVVETHVLKPVV